jgi:hypothetical protein
VITLSRLATSSDVVRASVGGPGCSVKDSFACLDLRSCGLEVLFEAHWIYRPPEIHPGAYSTWTVIHSDAEREAWMRAAHAEVAVPLAALCHPSVCVLAIERDGQIVTGAIANQSGSVVGVSNLFGAAWSDPATWVSLAAALATAFPTMALVGYETGDRLDAAVQARFQMIGPLRIWVQAP